MRMFMRVRRWSGGRKELLFPINFNCLKPSKWICFPKMLWWIIRLIVLAFFLSRGENVALWPSFASFLIVTDATLSHRKRIRAITAFSHFSKLPWGLKHRSPNRSISLQPHDGTELSKNFQAINLGWTWISSKTPRCMRWQRVVLEHYSGLIDRSVDFRFLYPFTARDRLQDKARRKAPRISKAPAFQTTAGGVWLRRERAGSTSLSLTSSADDVAFIKVTKADNERSSRETPYL